MKIFLASLALMVAGSASAQVVWIEGQHSGVKQTMAVAVQDPETWTEIWHQHDASAPVPQVDFSKENVVVVLSLMQGADAHARKKSV